MTRPFLQHGDVEALVIDILLNHTPELEPYDVVNISTDLRGYQAAMRWVKVTLEGGWTIIENIIRKPRVDMEVRAERRDVALDISNICIASLFRAVPHTAHGAVLSDIRTELEPVNVPDKEEEASYRYYMAFRLTCLIDFDSAPGAQS